MTPTGRIAIAALSSLVPVAVASGSFALAPTATVSTDPSLRCSARAQAEKFLGFEIGEQRRYVLGPPEALGAREAGSWAITLDEVYRTSAGAPEAVFLLSHDWHAALRAEEPLHMITAVRSHGTVRLNGDGFPLFIRYETEREIAGYGREAYTIDYRYEADRYRKLTTMDNGQRVDEVPIRGSDTLDLEAPAGLYAFLPAPPDCRDRYASTYNQPAPGDLLPPSLPGVPKGARVLEIIDCQESLFANPGLLGLVIPALWESKGEREFLFFTPLGPTGEMAGTVTAGISAGGGGVPGGRTGQRGSGRSGFSNPRRMGDTIFVTPSQHRDVEDLRLGVRVRVRVGNRTRDASMLTGPTRLGAIYVDDEGVILRVDLPGTGPGAPQKWIRMLWPSEF